MQQLCNWLSINRWLVKSVSMMPKQHALHRNAGAVEDRGSTWLKCRCTADMAGLAAWIRMQLRGSPFVVLILRRESIEDL